MFPRLVCILWMILAGMGVNAQNLTQHTVLPNGMTVILHPISHARNACLAVLYRMGSDQDPAGRSGLAHLLEHVYITAAAGDRKARTVDEFMQAYPNGWEAQTGADYTIFATVFPQANLAWELREAADRMSKLHVNASDLEREKPRLISEVSNMFGGLPSFAAWNFAHECVRPTPGKGRRGGVPEQVQAISVPEIQARWQRYYKPRNATLVLTGDFDPEVARKTIDQEFASLAAGEKAPDAVKMAPPHVGASEKITVKPITPAPNTEVCLMAAVPLPNDTQYAAILVLAARIQRHASEIAGAPAAGSAQRFPPPVYYAILNEPGVFSLCAAVPPGQTPEAVVNRLKDVIANVLKPGLQPGDIQSAKSQFGPFLGITPAADMFWIQNPYGLAFTLARQSQWGLDAAGLGKALDNLTNSELHQAGEKWFGEKQWATIIVEPK